MRMIIVPAVAFLAGCAALDRPPAPEGLEEPAAALGLRAEFLEIVPPPADAELVVDLAKLAPVAEAPPEELEVAPPPCPRPSFRWRNGTGEPALVSDHWSDGFVRTRTVPPGVEVEWSLTCEESDPACFGAPPDVGVQACAESGTAACFWLYRCDEGILEVFDGGSWDRGVLRVSFGDRSSPERELRGYGLTIFEIPLGFDLASVVRLVSKDGRTYSP